MSWRLTFMVIIFLLLMSLAVSLGFGQSELAPTPTPLPLPKLRSESGGENHAIAEAVLAEAAAKLQPKKYPSVKINGKLEVFYADYFNRERQKEGNYGELRFRPRVLMKFSDQWSAYAEGDFRKDNRGFAHGHLDDWQEGDYRASANLREYYLEYNKKWFRGRVGKQILDWSVTDTVSPSDNINPRDWTHLIEWERVGVPAIDLRFGYDTYLELVGIAGFTPSKLPQGRWETLELEDDYKIEGHGGSYAARVGTTIKGFDLTASYYNGFNYNPTVRVDVPPVRFDPLTGLPILPIPHFHPRYFREQVFAATVAKEIFNGYALRAEVGRFNQEIGRDFTQYVVGVDHEWSSLFRETDSLYALVQYAGDTSSDRERAGDIRRSLSDCAMLKIKYAPSDNERWTFGLDAAYNVNNGSSHLKPSVAWKKDNFKVEGGVAVMTGAKNSFFGQYEKNNYGFLAVSWEF